MANIILNEDNGAVREFAEVVAPAPEAPAEAAPEAAPEAPAAE